jgi:hypothetical protein
MTHPYRTAAALLATALASAPALAAAPTPQVGHYTQLYLVLSASVSGAGSCIDSVGTYFTEQFYFPGPSKKGAKAWRAFSLSDLLQNEVITFPETPAAGATTWSGTYSAQFLPNGATVKAKFSTSFTITDPSSSLGTTTVVGPTQQGGTCTETLQFNQFYTGK